MSQRIHLDATPGLFHQVLHCHQGDVGRQFEIAVVTRDGYEIPSGATFKIQATKPSGLGFTVTGTAANNIISFTSTEDMTSEAGEIPTQLEIKSGNDVIYTSNFLLVCEKNTHPASITDGSPEEIISEITLLVERAESAASTAGADAAAAAQARVDEMMDYLPSEVADLKSDLSDETSARILLAGRVTTAESNIDTLETHKVAQPLDEYNQPTDGTDGQSLRTKGDGTTEWADIGLPTDAQTAQAVTDWLNDHPEATTTVTDGSITYKKMTNGTLGFVIPEMFGAKGDGYTDDTAAIQAAIDSGFPVFMGNKTYLISDSIIVYGESVTGEGVKGTEIIGSNKTRILAAAEMTDPMILFGNRTTGESRSYGVTIKGLNLEANESIDKVVYCNEFAVSESCFEDITVSGGVNAFYFDKNTYLNNFRNCRAYHVSGIGFKVSGGTNTSNVFEKCYVDTAAVGFDLSGSYCSLISCAADVVSDIVYKFSYARFDVVSCGSESRDASACFEIGSSCKLAIMSGFYFGNVNNANAIHINFVGYNSYVTFYNTWLNLHSHSAGATNTPGKLYEFPLNNPNDYDNVLGFENCYIEKYFRNAEHNSYFYKVYKQNGYSNTNLRYGTIPFIGADTYSGLIDKESDNPQINGNALYLGFKTRNMTETGLNAGSLRHKENGDIILSKDPGDVGGIGWSVIDEASDLWANDKVAIIPIVQFGTDSEVPEGSSNTSYGALFYNTSSKQLQTWDGTKYSARGNYRLFRETLTADSNGILTTSIPVAKYSLLSCQASNRTGWVMVPFYKNGEYWSIKVMDSTDITVKGSGSFNMLLHTIQISD